MSATLFICGPKPPGCTAPSCNRPTATTCAFKLSGSKAGQPCGRALCDGHGKARLCPAHQRQVARELAKGNGA